MPRPARTSISVRATGSGSGRGPSSGRPSNACCRETTNATISTVVVMSAPGEWVEEAEEVQAARVRVGYTVRLQERPRVRGPLVVELDRGEREVGVPVGDP